MRGAGGFSLIGGQQRFVVSLPLSPSRYINRFWFILFPTVPVECDLSLLRRFDCSQRIGRHIVLARLGLVPVDIGFIRLLDFDRPSSVLVEASYSGLSRW